MYWTRRGLGGVQEQIGNGVVHEEGRERENMQERKRTMRERNR